MAETSAIEWTDSTFNPWIGCTKISPACDHCYAEALIDKRHGRVKWGGERVRTSVSNWRQPLRWQRQAAAFRAEHGRRRRVFCASLADVFDNQVPVDWRADLWALIRATPDLDWLLLTKRPQNIRKMLPAFWDEVKGHVWLGATVEDQTRADQNIAHLLDLDAAVRFLSIEPMLGPIDLTEVMAGGEEELNVLTPHTWEELKADWEGTSPEWQDEFADWYNVDFDCATGPAYRRIDWVIAGGESGPKARPSHPDWFRSLRDQCTAAGVPFLFKQWGEWGDADDLTSEQFEHYDVQDLTTDASARVGKKRAGRLLDGVTHDGFPDAQNGLAPA